MRHQPVASVRPGQMCDSSHPQPSLGTYLANSSEAFLSRLATYEPTTHPFFRGSVRKNMSVPSSRLSHSKTHTDRSDPYLRSPDSPRGAPRDPVANIHPQLHPPHPPHSLPHSTPPHPQAPPATPPGNSVRGPRWSPDTEWRSRTPGARPPACPNPGRSDWRRLGWGGGAGGGWGEKGVGR